MLVEYAKQELSIAGLFDKDADYDGMIGKAVLELVETFAAQDHSGFSANYVLEIFDKVSRFQPLTPITSKPEEWLDRTEESGRPMWQSKRNPSTFSTDGGQTWYDLHDTKR